MELSRVRAQAYMLCQHVYGARQANAFLANALLLESVRGVVEHLDQYDTPGFMNDYSGIFDSSLSKQRQSLNDFFAQEVAKVSLVELQDYFDFIGTQPRNPKFRQPSALYFELDKVDDGVRSNSNVGGIVVNGKNVAAWAYNLH